METVKNEVKSMLNKLPESCSLEDIQYHLYVLEKVKIGLERAEKEGSFTQDEAEERLEKWIVD